MAMINTILTFKDDFNYFLKNGALYIALGIVLLILIAIFLIAFLGRKIKK